MSLSDYRLEHVVGLKSCLFLLFLLCEYRIRTAEIKRSLFIRFQNSVRIFYVFLFRTITLPGVCTIKVRKLEGWY